MRVPGVRSSARATPPSRLGPSTGESLPLAPPAVITRSQWARLLLGLLAVFALFHWLADVLGSDRGQSGLLVGGVVVAATLLAERALFGRSRLSAIAAVGLGRPRATGLVTSGVICVLLVATALLFAQATGTTVLLHSQTPWLVPGLFAQAGVAEEVLFRGYLFGHLRRGRTFWTAAWLSMLPFVGVHLLLFLSMPWPLALAALLLSVIISIPLARLFELGGSTIWAPALLHFVVQGTIKVLVLRGQGASVFPFVWMAACATVPMLAFASRISADRGTSS
jgi:membrane protease YdiL (CAAX protease family)